MKRRDFITLLGGAAAAWPLAARAQQTATPVIGFLGTSSEAATAASLTAFRRGLNETGFAEGRNIAVEFRWAQGQYERLPAMAAKLVRRPVALIAAQASPAALAAKAATATIPIVFVVGFDPVGAGLVASLNRPGGNATGVTLISGELGPKRLEMLHELAPKASLPCLPIRSFRMRFRKLARCRRPRNRWGLQPAMFNASPPNEIETAFAAIAERRPDAFLVGGDPFFVVQLGDVVARTARLDLPAIYPFSEFAAAGGLMSYGTSLPNAYRQAGDYAGRILKGAEPADLPVMQPTTFELVVNLKTAKALGRTVPQSILARADEVIE